MSYLTFLGSSALTEFRRHALIKKLGVKDVRVRYVHFVALYESSGVIDYDRYNLEELLSYGQLYEEPEKQEEGTITWIVQPRKGTISPWSSKATSNVEARGHGNVIKRIERGMIIKIVPDGEFNGEKAKEELHDRMTQEIGLEMPDLEVMFGEHTPSPAKIINLSVRDSDPHYVLREANKTMGLALDDSEVDYLVDRFTGEKGLGRSPFDVELYMFAQINSGTLELAAHLKREAECETKSSEHCRHKQFNASWTIDGVKKDHSLFSMIRNTHVKNHKYVVSAYSDNAAVLDAPDDQNATFLSPQKSGEWTQLKEKVLSVIKAEGAATGAGGEIRDESAVGRGSRVKAGLSGLAVSDLRIPEFIQPWELDVGKPDHVASSLDILLEAPIGKASYENESGRPNVTGYFRTFLSKIPVPEGSREEIRGYHKPILLAGGLGTVRPMHAHKDATIVEPGSLIIALGGPAMLVGLGGGAASSQTSAEGSAHLDFASVQRGNAEIQRRAQEVINNCAAMGAKNPILFIHDIGAGGLSNGIPELLHDSNLGGTVELRNIDNADRGMSPLEVWCCEAQERFVLAISPGSLDTFKTIADRERCAFKVVGKADGQRAGTENRLLLTDRESEEYPHPINLPMETLFGKPPKLSRNVESRRLTLPAFDSSLASYLPKVKDGGVLEEAVQRVLNLPAVGSKSFLITIGDRSVSGLVVRDQMVGPFQVPVADVGITATSLSLGIKSGEAMAMGEKPIVALISPAASAHMAVAESLMNIAAADVELERVCLSANWMAAAGHPGEAAALYEAVEAIAMHFCPELGISIPVGKDSTSMSMAWKDRQTNEDRKVTAPLSLVVSAFAPVTNIRHWTPALQQKGETILLLVDLAEGYKSMGGSALAQVFSQIGNEAPDVRNVQLLKDYFDAIQQLHEAGIVLAYHDRSEGGLFTTIAEMMFAGGCGVQVVIDEICQNVNETSEVLQSLFNEELGAVFQIRKEDEIDFHRCFATCGPPPNLIKKIGRVGSNSEEDLTIYHGTALIYRQKRTSLQRTWSATSHQMQRLRDNPVCADQEFDGILDTSNPGLSYNLTFDPAKNLMPFASKLPSVGILNNKPKVAILREQGTNGQAEMAFAFMTAGFIAVDVHMTDLIEGRTSLKDFTGLAACGGFSYGDVLGAGRGWASTVLHRPSLMDQFGVFFERKDTFTLGVCNGCQFLTQLWIKIKGTTQWPTFETNTSEQYEARVAMVKITDSPTHPNVFLHGMHNSTLPIAVAHQEGRASFEVPESAQQMMEDGQVVMQYVDNTTLEPTEKYPANPNGSPLGIAGISAADGRLLAMMPHAERSTLFASWFPEDRAAEWGPTLPWQRMFYSARRWVSI
ncbi:phosphoribosylformylglycinamidine synthase [Lecanora helva]